MRLVQMPDEAVCVWFPANALGKGMNPSGLPHLLANSEAD